MVHYHLTNKNLSWAQVRDAGARVIHGKRREGRRGSGHFAQAHPEGSVVMEGLCLLVASFPTHISLLGSTALVLGGLRAT